MRLALAMTLPMHSLSINECHAAWHATSEDEQAVSYDAHAPCKPSTNDMRPDAIEFAEPVAAYTLLAAGLAFRISPYSLPEKATKAPVRLPLSVVRSHMLSCNAV